MPQTNSPHVPSQHHGISFEKSISVGHILTILSIVSAAVSLFVTYRVTITEHEGRLRTLEIQVQTQTATNSQLSTMMYNIRQDVAVIRDRLERSK